MKYLDREPRAGDRVHVNYEGTVENVGREERSPSVTVRRPDEWMAFVNAADIRVIAPEPKIGDVVTEDMDLPDGSIIAHSSGGVGVKERDNRIYIAGMASPRLLSDLSDLSSWRIVRIGGGAL